MLGKKTMESAVPLHDSLKEPRYLTSLFLEPPLEIFNIYTNEHPGNQPRLPMRDDCYSHTTFS